MELPSDRLRKLETDANHAFDTYREMYFESGICSVYLWDLDHGFAGVILIKKGEQNLPFSGPSSPAGSGRCLMGWKFVLDVWSLSLVMWTFCFWTSGRLDVWISGHLDIWTSGYLDVWTSGCLDIWTSGNLVVLVV